MWIERHSDAEDKLREKTEDEMKERIGRKDKHGTEGYKGSKVLHQPNLMFI